MLLPLQYVSAPAYLGNFSNPLANQPKDGFMYASIVAAPLSRGNVTIRSADTTTTTDPPVINPNVLTSPTDQQVAVASYKRIRQMFQSSEMGGAGSHRGRVLPRSECPERRGNLREWRGLLSCRELMRNGGTPNAPNTNAGRCGRESESHWRDGRAMWLMLRKVSVDRSRPERSFVVDHRIAVSSPEPYPELDL